MSSNFGPPKTPKSGILSVGQYLFKVRDIQGGADHPIK